MTNAVNAATPSSKLPLLVVLSLAVVYVVWGSTYLVIRIALEGYPPLFFPGIRFLLAGGILYGVLRLRGYARPTIHQWRNAVIIGFLLLNIGNGAVVYAERFVGSALAATAVATVPLWVALFAGLWGAWPGRVQWLGLMLGFISIVVLNLGGDFAANPLSAALLLFSPLCWAFGSVWSRRLDLPAGLMSSAAQMVVAGIMFLIASAVAGEPWHLAASPRAIGALFYLTVFGSLLAFSAYMYLVQNVSPALATSYAYVNPMVAVVLGLSFAGEHFNDREFFAIGLVLAGVLLIVATNRRSPVKPAEAVAPVPAANVKIGIETE